MSFLKSSIFLFLCIYFLNLFETNKKNTKNFFLIDLKLKANTHTNISILFTLIIKLHHLIFFRVKKTYFLIDYVIFKKIYLYQYQ